MKLKIYGLLHVLTHVVQVNARKENDLIPGREFLHNADGGCALFQCPYNWGPKDNHDEIKAVPGKKLTKELCCEPLCGGHQCGPGFVENVLYALNPGMTDPQCCDMTCDNRANSFTCPRGHVVTPAMKKKAGRDATTCCSATCRTVACVAPKAPPPSSASSWDLISTDPDTCCEDTCASIVCPEGSTQFDLDKRSADPKECCKPSCGNHMCPLGTTRVENASTVVQNEDKGSNCCVQKCSTEGNDFGYKCSEGWIAIDDGRKCSKQPCTDVMCCQKTCGIYQCPDGTQRNEAVKDKWPARDEKCCLKSCPLVDCSGIFVPGSNMRRQRNTTFTIPGKLDQEVCCDKYCSSVQFECHKIGKSPIPNFSLTEGDNTTTCCETPSCEVWRHLTRTQDAGCNGQGNSTTCDMYYTSLNNTRTKRLDHVRCFWNAKFTVCQVGDATDPKMRMPDDCHEIP